MYIKLHRVTRETLGRSPGGRRRDRHLPEPRPGGARVTAAWLLALLVLMAGASTAWPRWRRARGLAARSQREDVLKHMLKCETRGERPTLDSIAGAVQISTGDAASLIQELQEVGMVSCDDGPLVLKPAGREMAMHIIRAHRLWESYLAERTGVDAREWHERAEHQEHLLTPGEADALAAQLGHPTHDPHGDEIPGVGGALLAEPGQPLHTIRQNTPVMITHIEDEPETVYAQLCAAGLRAGMRAYVMEKSPHRIRFWADGREHVLAPVLASNISVSVLPEFKLEDLANQDFLSSLQPGERRRITGLSPACHGAERRRLLDLGFVAGTPVEVEMTSPAGDPTAYRVRGTVIALRREQAGLIWVERALAS
jgi:DtxR family Mn-dependent transcriptional regulator